jgi:alpha-tubulin suppressor-like RCC1 family protein
VPVAIARDVTAVAAGRFHSLAIRGGGTVWGFGDASSCQLGDGAGLSTWTPVRAALGEPAVVVTAGDYHSAALADSGVVAAWGDDSRGALGRAGPDLSGIGCVAAEVAVPAFLAAAGEAFTVLAIPDAPGP